MRKLLSDFIEFLFEYHFIFWVGSGYLAGSGHWFYAFCFVLLTVAIERYLIGSISEADLEADLEAI